MYHHRRCRIFPSYETVVVLLTDLSPLKEEVLALASWVEQGGSAMFALTLQKNTYVSLIEQKLGILSSGYDNVLVDSILNRIFCLAAECHMTLQTDMIRRGR